MEENRELKSEELEKVVGSSYDINAHDIYNTPLKCKCGFIAKNAKEFATHIRQNPYHVSIVSN